MTWWLDGAGVNYWVIHERRRASDVGVLVWSLVGAAGLVGLLGVLALLNLVLH